MFGNRRALEQTLRERGGRTAMATIVAYGTRTIGLDNIDYLARLPDGSNGWRPRPRLLTRMRMTVRVEPPGEPPFEAKLVDYVSGRGDLEKDYTVAVIYDPDQHSKIARDRSPEGEARTDEASKRTTQEILRRNQERAGLRPRAEAPKVAASPLDELAKLADLRDRGALTDAEFQARKAALLRQG